MRMNCSDVVARFTDYLDGVSPPAEQAAIEKHLEHCSACARYRNVVVHGADLLRRLPEPELQHDFEPRLKHRLFHVDDERALTAHAASGAPAMTVLGIALLLTAVAWSPALFLGAPTVELPMIVVDDPPSRDSSQPVTPPGVFSTTQPGPEMDEGLWANQLIYDYSPLSQRYERRSRVRRVVRFDR
ncbi:MAG: zf-HC2 domain-containing protein [Longimicrobiales bacterium]|nr:zf-HC2 domain-containing protein [Longimicrobiales bacterium]